MCRVVRGWDKQGGYKRDGLDSRGAGRCPNRRTARHNPSTRQEGIPTAQRRQKHMNDMKTSCLQLFSELASKLQRSPKNSSQVSRFAPTDNRQAQETTAVAQDPVQDDRAGRAFETSSKQKGISRSTGSPQQWRTCEHDWQPRSKWLAGDKVMESVRAGQICVLTRKEGANVRNSSLHGFGPIGMKTVKEKKRRETGVAPVWRWCGRHRKGEMVWRRLREMRESGSVRDQCSRNDWEIRASSPRSLTSTS